MDWKWSSGAMLEADNSVEVFKDNNKLDCAFCGGKGEVEIENWTLFSLIQRLTAGALDLGPSKQAAPTPTPSTAKVPPQTRTPPSPRDLDLGSRFLGQGASLGMRSSQGGQQAALDLVRPCTCN